MCVTFYTVDDLRPGRSTGWSIRRFQALKDAISHYRTLPAERTRILGMADEGHVWELIRCVRLFPGEAQGEDVLAADYRSCGLTRELPELKKALNTCVDELRPRYMLEPERMVPIPTGKNCGRSCGTNCSGVDMAGNTIPRSAACMFTASAGSRPRM